jgi:hypothetical protein
MLWKRCVTHLLRACCLPDVRFPCKIILGAHCKRSNGLAGTVGLTVWSVLLRSMDCSDCRFDSRWAHGLSSLVFAVCCVCSGLGDVLIPRSGETYRVCVFVCGPWTRILGCLGQNWDVATQKQNKWWVYFHTSFHAIKFPKVPHSVCYCKHSLCK